MPLRFFQALRAGGLKPSVQEYLALLGALQAQVIAPDLTEFHSLARLCLIKDEAQFDRFDQIFSAYMEGLERVWLDPQQVPAEWLQRQAERIFSAEERAAIDAAMKENNFDELIKKLAERLREQSKRHEGGNRQIGTLGSSSFGNGGYNPLGVRIGGHGQQGRATKVWEQRIYRDYSDDALIGVRESKLALRKLRKFARDGANLELDLDDTIRSTARNAGWLDVRMQRERHNAIKVMLLLDVGGSMDEYTQRVSNLFSAAKSEFKHLEHYYFHNCLYERVWKDNARRKQSEVPTAELLHRLDASWKVIFVGDASMSPYELLSPGGSVEHWNQEAGEAWLKRTLQAFPRCVWINPTDGKHWHYTPSIQLINELFQSRMFPLTLNGLDGAIASLLGKKTVRAELN
jgi:uncharacterized protein